MSISWQTEQQADTTTLSTRCEASDSRGLKPTVEAGLDEMINRLPLEISDQAMYLLCQWQPSNKQLTLFLADEQRKPCANTTVSCHFPAFSDDEEALAELKFLLRDYLTTASGFLQFSLIAAFMPNLETSPQLL